MDSLKKRFEEMFRRIEIDPSKARIAIDDERYVLIRASAFSIDFLDTVVQLYADRGEREALAIARGFLFDIAHTIGIHDARSIHEKIGAKDPLEKLTGGPIHFAHTGWASVDIKPSSRPVADDSFCLVYEHPYSFEAASFVTAGRRSEGPACIMNAGYSSGWCQESFGVELTAVEVKCRARGDNGCFFVMAPPDRVHERVREHFGVDLGELYKHGFDVPTYFERKRAEEELRLSVARLEKAQEELIRKERLATIGLLVSGVAHEVNTPLGVGVTAIGVVNEEIEGLKAKFQSGKMSKADLVTFFERSQQATALVSANLERAAEHITKFKRVAVDNTSEERRRIDLGSYARETLDSLRPVAKKAGFTIHLSCEGDLECTTHPGAIAQLLTNFVTNSALHSGATKVDVRLTRLADGRIELRYSDDGRGMTDEVRAHAFQAFYTTRRGSGGSGLGLHIVQSLVTTVLAGRIELTSAPGQGVAFEVSFPVGRRDEPSMITPINLNLSSSSSSSSNE